MRYIRTLFLIAFIGAAAVAAQSLFQFLDLDASLNDRRGAGQLTLFAIVIPSLLWFSWAVAGVNPVAFGARYVADWRRVLRGFLLMYGATTLILATSFIVLTAMGKVQWSQEAWQNLTTNVAMKTVSGLLVVLVLATVEELIFRGFFLRYLRHNDTLRVTVAAIIASSLIFSLSHLIALSGSWHDPAKIPLLFGLFIIGLLAGTTYVVTGSIACSIGIHCGLLGFKVFFRKTDLATLSPDGAWWLGGTSDLRIGPLSWIVLLSMTVAIILCRRWLWDRLWVETAVGLEREEVPVGREPATVSSARMGFRSEGSDFRA